MEEMDDQAFTTLFGQVTGGITHALFVQGGDNMAIGVHALVYLQTEFTADQGLETADQFDPRPPHGLLLRTPL